MNTIITKELIDVRYALGSADTAKARYNQIKGTFPDGNEYRIFAEPIIMGGGNKITWVTEYDGGIINFNQLSPEEQSHAKDMLSEQMKKLFNAAKKYEDNSLVEFLYKCIEIPNLKDIFIVRKDNTDRVVLTQWGFMSDIPGAEKGLLEKIINAKKVPMVFSVVYTDETIAPHHEIHFEYEGKKTILKSNDQGMITIDGVKVDSFVKAYEVEKNVPFNFHSFTCYEFGRFQIKVALRVDMKFKVVSSKQNVLPNYSFKFSWNDETTELITDINGIMVLPKIKVETEVKVWQDVAGKEENINRFICEQKKEEYLIVVQLPEEPVFVPDPPKVHNMKFKVVDGKGNVIPSAEVIVEYSGKKATLFTDEYGYAILENVEPGTKVKVIAKKEKK